MVDLMRFKIFAMFRDFQVSGGSRYQAVKGSDFPQQTWQESILTSYHAKGEREEQKGHSIAQGS